MSNEWVQDLPCRLHHVRLKSLRSRTLEHFLFQSKRSLYLLCVCVYHFAKEAHVSISQCLLISQACYLC